MLRDWHNQVKVPQKCVQMIFKIILTLILVSKIRFRSMLLSGNKHLDLLFYGNQVLPLVVRPPKKLCARELTVLTAKWEPYDYFIIAHCFPVDWKGKVMMQICIYMCERLLLFCCQVAFNLRGPYEWEISWQLFQTSLWLPLGNQSISYLAFLFFCCLQSFWALFSFSENLVFLWCAEMKVMYGKESSESC